MTRDLPVSPTPGQPLRAENVGFRRAVREEANALYDELGSDKAAAFDRFMRDLGPVVVSRFAARLVSAEPDRAEGGEGAENAQRIDEPLKWFLRMMEAAGGEVSSTDYSGNPINVFCDDRGDSDDTFNLSETLGFTATSHDTSFDSSVTRLTAKGRAALSALKAPPTPAVEREGLAEAVRGIDDDYMTSEAHHPGYVLIPVAKFEALRLAAAKEPS